MEVFNPISVRGLIFKFAVGKLERILQHIKSPHYFKLYEIGAIKCVSATDFHKWLVILR